MWENLELHMTYSIKYRLYADVTVSLIY